MDDKMLTKIEGLLRKAERTDNSAESEAFYAKAQELMAKYAIDEAMLRSTRKADVKPILKEIVLNKSGLWKANLALIGCIARPNDVQMVYIEPRGKGSKPVVKLVGFAEDVAAVEMLYMSMLIQNTRMRRTMMPADYTTQAQKVPWMRSFIIGFAARIEERLTEMKRNATEAATVEYGSNLLPVLASKAQIVQDDFAQRFPRLKAARNRQAMDYSGHGAGRAAADRADIGSKRIGGRKAIGS